MFGDEQPIDNAVQEQIHYFGYRDGSIINNPIAWENFNNNCRDIIKLPDGNYRGIRKDASDVWVVEIDNLNDFVKKYGQIVLSESNTEEGYMSVEIYDDYRE
jgi:hypothetical protein